jgi:hypothetical protein
MMRILKKIILPICISLALSTFACGTRHMIQGQVKDAETGKPIEGAAVAIHWYKYKIGPPLASGYKRVETAEDLTDNKGYFKLPRYTSRKYYMGAYKEGYVCWNNETILHPLGKSYEDRIEKRTGHRVYDGMVIKLEPFKSEYPRNKHAGYTVNVAGRLFTSGFGLFDKAIESETRLYRKILQED